MVATGVISELSGNERLTEHNDVKAASTTYPSAVQLQVIGVSVVTFTLLLSAIFATTAVPLDMSEMPYSQKQKLLLLLDGRLSLCFRAYKIRRRGIQGQMRNETERRKERKNRRKQRRGI